MSLVDQWRSVEQGLPSTWTGVRLTLRPEQPEDLPRAAQLLGPATPGRVGGALVVHVSRAGGALGVEAARRLFARLDEERIWCVLDEARAAEDAVGGDQSGAASTSTLASSWDDALAMLPQDWSALHCELEVRSSDYLARTALLCAPLNPSRVQGKLAFAFRCAAKDGYGASAAMVRRCFERLDAEGIDGEVRVPRVLSEVGNVGTQGPVWLVGGRVV